MWFFAWPRSVGSSGIAFWLRSAQSVFSSLPEADTRKTPLFEELDQGGTRRGELLLSLLDSEDVAGMLHSAGFRVVEELPSSEIRRRHIYERSDGLDIPGFARLCCAEREGAVQ